MKPDLRIPVELDQGVAETVVAANDDGRLVDEKSYEIPLGQGVYLVVETEAKIDG